MGKAETEAPWRQGRSGAMRLGVGWRLLVCNGLASVVSLVLAGAVLASPVSPQTPDSAGHVSVKKKPKRPAAKPLTRAQVVALIRQFAGQGPAGPGGAPGPSGAQGALGPVGPSTGP